MNSNVFKLRKRYDAAIPIVALVLTIVGLVMILSASQISAADKYGNAYYFFSRQLIFWVIGVGFFFYFLRTPIDRLYENRANYLIITLVALVLVFVPIIGPKIAGVHRWLNFGIFTLQPAEFAKLFLIIYFSGWFAAKGPLIRDPIKGLIPFMALLGLIGLLTVVEPDMGTTIIILLISLCLFFAAEAQLLQFVALIIVGVALLAILTVLAPYRMQRVTTFLNRNNTTSQDALGAAYHNQQALIAIGSGGMWGVGFGQGTSKYSYLPQSHTDSIFAVIAEELGFARSSLILLAFLFLGWRAFIIARRANSRFVRLLAVGIGVSILSQAMINVGGMLHILPLTGVPLPFISYGGSSLVVSMASVGLLTNISREVI